MTSVAVRVWDSRVRLKKQKLAVEWMPIAFRCTQQVNTGTLANTLGPANPRERPFNTLSDESLNPAEPSKSLFQKRCKRGNGVQLCKTTPSNSAGNYEIQNTSFNFKP